MAEEKKPELPWMLSPRGVVEVYANNMHVTWTKDDLRIRLAQIVEDPTAPTPGAEFKAVNQERVAVTFNWRGAKILRNQLNRIIAAYEKANGEVNIDVTLPASFGDEEPDDKEVVQ
jgi:hypothetical protein